MFERLIQALFNDDERDTTEVPKQNIEHDFTLSFLILLRC